MKLRLRAAWYALRGRPVIIAKDWVAIYVDTDGANVCRWEGLSREDMIEMLYQSADAMVDRLNGNVTIH